MKFEEEQDIEEATGGIGGTLAALTGAGLITVACLPAVIVAGVTYLLFLKGRIAPSVFALIAALYAGVLAVTGLWQQVLAMYLASWSRLPQVLEGGDGEGSVVLRVLSTFGQVLLLQLPLLAGVGLVLGTVIAYIRYWRRAAWEEFDFRLTPFQYGRKLRNVRQLRKGEGANPRGATLGVDPKGHKVHQLDTEATSHTFIPGASGSGKTTTMMAQAKDHIRRGHGVAFIDLKGSADVAEQLYAYAKQFGREFYHFEIVNPQEGYSGPAPEGCSFYDPLSRGDASRRKDMIIAGREWSEDYYRNIAEDYLQTAFGVAIAVPPPPGTDAINDVIQLLKPSELKKRSELLPADGGEFSELRIAAEAWAAKKLDRGQESAINGVRTDIQVLKGSSAGRYLRQPANPDDRTINLKNAAHSGAVVVFSLDSSNYSSLAARIANFAIQDLKTVSSELRKDPISKPFHIYIDEFSAIDSRTVINLINKSRDAKMPVTLSTQALGDLTRVDPTFPDQLNGIINCFIIHRANQEADVALYAGLAGKTKKWRRSYSVARSGGVLGALGLGRRTGSGNVEEVEDYRVSPSEIQDLKTGHAIYLAKSPQQRLVRVEVIPEEHQSAPEEAQDGHPTPEPADIEEREEAQPASQPAPARSTAATSEVTNTWEEAIEEEAVEEEAPQPRRARPSRAAATTLPTLPTLPRRAREEAPVASEPLRAGWSDEEEDWGADEEELSPRPQSQPKRAVAAAPQRVTKAPPVLDMGDF